MSGQFTSAWLAAHESRRSIPRAGGETSGCEKESKLHEQIFAECRRRGWIVFHGAMSERTHRTAGEPDFVILTDLSQRWISGEPEDYAEHYKIPRVLFIECKTRTGKLSTAQAAMKFHAAKLGHAIHVIRSFEEFLAIISGPTVGPGNTEKP